MHVTAKFPDKIDKITNYPNRQRIYNLIKSDGIPGSEVQHVRIYLEMRACTVKFGPRYLF